MNKIFTAILGGLLAVSGLGAQPRSETLLRDWEFRKDHEMNAAQGWENVRVPHDWAIYGPFDKANDLQTVAVIQNGETTPSEKTGRTGGLPYMGKGCYRTRIDIDKNEGRRFELLFDGAMSEAQVYVNGEKVTEWPYGYNAFHCDITSALRDGSNEVAVLLENRPFSSRWYPGAGLFRKVRLIETSAVHVPVWGVRVTTPHVEKDYASISIETEIEGAGEGETFELNTVIFNSEGAAVASRSDLRAICHGEAARQNITLERPALWSPESPALYTAVTRVMKDGSVVDSVSTRFGVRTVEFVADKGFFLNGERRVIHGVCQHHDLGPLGAAVNRSALRHQIEMLKEMGCDAIRTSHNMPAEELVELCDEMGVMLMAETFDEWDVAKCENGYHRFFNDWAEKDVVNLVRHFRNSPSVIMWSIGNEVPTQWTPGGYRTAAWLQSICHREDPTRAVTCGMDQFDAVVNNGFGAQVDIPGFNYKPRRYVEAYGKLPQNIILGSETASTVSSRGVYHLPSEGGFDSLIGPDRLHEDHQSSSYDVETCYWSNIPDVDLAADEDYPWVPGQFVWTGFDYLGEPSPYDTDAWPSHSSVFGTIDLASIPKDRYWLYRSVWRKDVPTLHVLPHWTWPGHEGENVPVVAYTSFDRAELFVNGVSQGVVEKGVAAGGGAGSGSGSGKAVAVPAGGAAVAGDAAVAGAGSGVSGKAVSAGVAASPAEPQPLASDSELTRRFRLIWPDVVYEPGEIRVVAYAEDGSVAAEETVRTAGKAYALRLTPHTGVLQADGEDLCYVNVCVVDRDGNPVPGDSREVKVSVEGAGSFRAIANGDPTCLEPFHLPHMHLFSGQLTAIVQSAEIDGDAAASSNGGAGSKVSASGQGSEVSGSPVGEITVKVSAKGLKPGIAKIQVVK